MLETSFPDIEVVGECASVAESVARLREENYTKTLYDQVGWTEEVLTFLRYNANKALMNLGQDPLFPDTANDVNPIVMNGISTGTANHDFFSQVGNGYLLGSVEAMQDDDYNYGLD